MNTELIIIYYKRNKTKSYNFIIGIKIFMSKHKYSKKFIFFNINVYMLQKKTKK